MKYTYYKALGLWDKTSYNIWRKYYDSEVYPHFEWKCNDRWIEDNDTFNRLRQNGDIIELSKEETFAELL